MYTPRLNREDDLDKLFNLMERFSFATVVTGDTGDTDTSVAGAPVATHLPVVLDRTRGAHGTLVSHMARANPQWQSFASGSETLVIFQGPHAYLSPTWYASEFNVPTWNYAVAHAYGTPQIIDDPARLRPMLDALVAQYEQHQPQPWQVDWADVRNDGLLGAIVGFEMEITRLEGKFKMSQNKSAADQRGVVDALAKSRNSLEAEVAEIMSKE